MHRFAVGAILALCVSTSGAIQISSTLTSSTLSVSGGFTTDPAGWSADQWTDLANWPLSLTVYDGYAERSSHHSMFGTLAPGSQLRWEYAGEVSWTSGLNPDGSPEAGFWAFTSCGSPPVGSGCGDRQIHIGGAPGHETFTGEIVLSNDTLDHVTPYFLEGGFGMWGQSSVPAPVPEPSTNALALAGLVAVGWMAMLRRRRLQGRPAATKSESADDSHS
jgi:hypothetical protein